MGLSFLYPWLLVGLLTLPALWWILRATPPAPRRQILPSLSLLRDIPQRQVTPAQTPWWLLILRLCLLGLLIIGLAGPRWQQVPTTTIPKKSLLVIDNNWASAPAWTPIMATARAFIAQADANGGKIMLASTTPMPNQPKPTISTLMPPDLAAQTLATFSPQPWLPTYLSALNDVKQIDVDSIYFLGADIEQPGQTDVIKQLSARAPVTFLTPEPAYDPVILSRLDDQTIEQMGIRMSVARPQAQDMTIPLELYDPQNKLITTIKEILPANHLYIDITLDRTHTQNLGYMRARHGDNAAGTLFLDGLTNRKQVCIISEIEENTSPFTKADYYLARALEPFAQVERQTLDQAMGRGTDIIITPDLPDPTPKTEQQLLAWLDQGGVLLRFAGPNTATSKRPSLLPLPLIQGERNLGGLGNWAVPPSLASFTTTSPFYGMPIPNDLNIRRQVLVEPSSNNPAIQIWAQLTDGTPLITARKVGHGYIVLVHTGAAPDWSDLPLSGFYLTVLKHVLALQPARQHSTSISSSNTYERRTPILTVSAHGDIAPPSAMAKAIDTKDLQNIIPNLSHPPGLYQADETQFALNLGERISSLGTAILPDGVNKQFMTATSFDHPLAPYIFTAVLILFVMDLLALILLQRGLLRAFLVLLVCGAAMPAYAAPIDPALTHLAYIQTGDSAQDQTSRAGLTQLMETVAQRTSIATGNVYGIAPDRDDLSLFPFIYWPITEQSTAKINEAAQEKLRAYVSHGGMLVFDTGDYSTTVPPIPTARFRALQTILSQLNLGRIKPIPNEHVLRRSFYLLSPDTAETTYLPTNLRQDNDQVAGVIVRSDNLALAWSHHGTGPFFEDGEEQMKFGVNLMLYALTGNYKADQVHIPFILERLGKGGQP